MNTYNVVISVTTTVCIDAKSADVANNIGYSMRNGHYEVTDAIPMDEDYDEDSDNEEDDESEE